MIISKKQFIKLISEKKLPRKKQVVFLKSGRVLIKTNE